jgi:hypothetical protein
MFDFICQEFPVAGIRPYHPRTLAKEVIQSEAMNLPPPELGVTA